MRNINFSSGVAMDFLQVLEKVQEYLSSRHSDLNVDDKFQVKRFVKKYVEEKKYSVEGMSLDTLTDQLYREMVEYSFLTPYLNFDIKGVEGIEIDSWESVRIKYTGGKCEHSKEHFFSPQHANNIMKRLLHQSQITFDNAKPLVRGHLGDKTRITVIGPSVLDKSVGIACSIRFVNPRDLRAEDIIGYGTATKEMMDFLSLAYRYGASTLVAGETDAGKTTIISIILDVVPDNKKLISIENGTREFNKTRRDEKGNVVNSVLHLVTRDSDDESTAVTQQMLLEQAMTMNPDYLCMAEVKGSEAFETIEASLTGHPVIGTIHTGCCKDIPDRMVQLASYHKSNLSDTTLYTLAIKAFPILVYSQNCDDGVRRITEICECRIENGQPAFQTLWEFITTGNRIVGGKTVVDGHFEKIGTISTDLQNRLLRKGMPKDILRKFLKLEGVPSNDSRQIDRLSRHVGRLSDSAESVAV